VGSTTAGEPTMADGTRHYKVRVGVGGREVKLCIKSPDQAVMGVEDLASAG
jgi:hypothetical protein